MKIDKKYIGVDKPKVNNVIEKEPHWTELEELRKNAPKLPAQPPREYGDNDPASPEQNWS